MCWRKLTPIGFCRSWEKIYVRLQGSTICCYKDQKSARNHPDVYHKGESPIELRDGSVEKATDYVKKTNVFRVKYVSWIRMYVCGLVSVVNEDCFVFSGQLMVLNICSNRKKMILRIYRCGYRRYQRLSKKALSQALRNLKPYQLRRAREKTNLKDVASLR